MILKIFSVFDSATGAYLQPFFAASQGSAIRSFMDACNDTAHEFSKHASDYTLFILGEFDDSDGSIRSENPLRLMNALEAVLRDISPPPKQTS